MIDTSDLMAQSLAGAAAAAALMRPAGGPTPANAAESGSRADETAPATTGGGPLLAGEAALAASLAEDDGQDAADKDAEDSAKEQPAGEVQGEEGLDDLSPEEERVVQELRQRDAEVRRHEQAHAAAGGRFTGAPSYEYTTGPDGKRYAVGGEVSINAGAVSGNPQATIEKMQAVKRAALAPTNPSAQDRRVAAQADQQLSQARVELRQDKAEEARDAREEREAEPDAAETATAKTEETPAGDPATASVDGEGESGRPAQNTATGAGERAAGRPIDAATLFNVIT